MRRDGPNQAGLHETPSRGLLHGDNAIVLIHGSPFKQFWLAITSAGKKALIIVERGYPFFQIPDVVARCLFSIPLAAFCSAICSLALGTGPFIFSKIRGQNDHENFTSKRA